MSTLGMKATQSSTQNRPPGFPASPPLDCGAEPCDAVHRGFNAFLDRRLNGIDTNGRACADRHMLTDNFQLSPADVEARFQLLQQRRQTDSDADDPLFRAIDA